VKKSVSTALALGAAAALAATAVAAPAAAAPKNKGTTFVAPSDVTASVLVDVLRPGSLGDKGAGFGIVGNPASGTIKHVGGLSVNGSAGILMDADLELRNFWIEVADGVVSGDVENFGRADLFTFEANDEGSFDLFFTETASLAVIGTDGIEGEFAGTASIETP
jgi:hypothetical protein